ncbi:MAG: hypothetical protein ACI9LM_005167 [Alteromonadaceae bacterium]|jgi:hypothetical protein
MNVAKYEIYQNIEQKILLARLHRFQINGWLSCILFKYCLTKESVNLEIYTK